MQTIKLDIAQKNNVPLLYVKQRDVGHTFAIELYENGALYPVNEGNTFSVWYSGASGDGNYTEIDGKTAVSVDGNHIEVQMIMQMLNEPGGHEMCVVMYGQDNKQKGFWNIPYFVEAIPGADSEAATAYYNAFLDAQKKAEEAAERAEAAADRAEAAGGIGDVKPKDVIVTAEFEAAVPDGSTGAMVANGTSDLTALEIATAIRGGATVKLIDNDNIVYEYDGYRLEPNNGHARFKAEVPTEEGIKVYRVNINNELYAGRVETLIAYGGGGSAEDAVTYTPQTLTEEQKAQARENIDAASQEEVYQYIDIRTDGIVKYNEDQWWLTEENKAQARKNIGIVDKHYEPIKTITVEESVTRIDITTDANEVPLNLAAVCIRVQMQAGEKASYFSSQMYPVGELSNADATFNFYVAGGITTTTANTIIYLFPLYGHMVGMASNPVPNTWDSPSQWKPPVYDRMCREAKPIGKVRVSGGINIPVGSIIEILGVRANA